MVDIENEVFTTVATALRTAVSGIFVSGERIAAPKNFPCASIVEADNSTYLKTLGSSLTENHSDLMYQADVYSNLTSGRKTQAKTILATIDAQMLSLGFTRAGRSPNAESADYIRMIARYRGVAGASIDAKSIQVYRR